MSETARLFMFMAIYGGITLACYFACMWLIRIDERRAARKARR